MTFLILKMEPVVALDLTDLIRMQVSDADVVNINERSDLRAVIEALPKITAVFVPASRHDAFLAEASRDVRERGGTIVQIGGDRVPLFDGLDDFIVVPSPFTNENIAAALSEIMSRHCAAHDRETA